MPYVTIRHSPLAGKSSEIYFRSSGSGTPLVFLHGGWGYDIYPIDSQFPATADFRLFIPDRSGYGLSTKPALFGPDFHHRAVQETLEFLDKCGLDRCVFWGHSDGAVISALLGLAAPERCLGLVLEAFHYDREKPHSRTFFQTMATAPEAFGERVTAVLKKEHGDSYWRELICSEGQAWLEIAGVARGSHKDLFDGRLSQLRVPTLILHGSDDPRTEQWELAAVRAELPRATLVMIEGGGHSPHSEAASSSVFGRHLRQWLSAWRNA